MPAVTAVPEPTGIELGGVRAVGSGRGALEWVNCPQKVTGYYFRHGLWP
ncbi:hypothetical protein OG217_35930 [Streptomyces sp. NBC_01023]|nr:hypothetical protein OG217_35930 [Streptomyces sp. NBC_01023]